MRTSAPFWTWLSHFTDWLLPLSSQPGDMPESDSTAIHYSNSFFLWEGNVYFYLRGLDLIWVLQGPDWLTPQSFWLWDSTSWFLYVDREVCSFFKKRWKVLRCFVRSLPARSINHENQYPMPQRKYKPAPHISGYQCIITHLSFLLDFYKQSSEVPCLRNACVIMPGCRNERADKKT